MSACVKHLTLEGQERLYFPNSKITCNLNWENVTAPAPPRPSTLRKLTTYLYITRHFSSHFVNVVSKALGISKWRLFNIRIEKAEVERCKEVKFGIIGKGKLTFIVLSFSLRFIGLMQKSKAQTIHQVVERGPCTTDTNESIGAAVQSPRNPVSRLVTIEDMFGKLKSRQQNLDLKF